MCCCDVCVPADPCVSDFLLTHKVFMPSSQLCPALQHQYPDMVNNTDNSNDVTGDKVHCHCLCCRCCGIVHVIVSDCEACDVVLLNRLCTYQAELSEGSDQEKAAYILNTKQKVVKLVGQWVALYGLLLKEDPVALDFLEVRLQS